MCKNKIRVGLLKIENNSASVRKGKNYVKFLLLINCLVITRYNKIIFLNEQQGQQSKSKISIKSLN